MPRPPHAGTDDVRPPVPQGPTRWVWIALVALCFVVLRLAFVRADPPIELPHEINTSEDFFVEPTAKAHEARNRAVHGAWHTNAADRYQFWRAQSPCWVYPLAWAFEAFGTNYTTLRVFSIAVALVGFLAFAAMARERPLGFWFGAVLLCINFYAITYDRSGLIEVMVSSAIAVMVLCLDRAWKDPLYLVGSQAAFAVAFFAKQGAIYGFPILLGFNIWIFLHHLRAPQRDGTSKDAWKIWIPLISAAIIGAFALWVIGGEHYQRALRWNFRHMLFSRIQQKGTGPKVEAFAWRITDFSRFHKGFFGLWPIVGIAAAGIGLREIGRWFVGHAIDRRRLLLVAWLASAWLALNLARQTDTRFFAIVVLPAHLLAVEAVQAWIEWGKSQPRPQGARRVAVLAFTLSAVLHASYYGWWASHRRYDIVEFNALVAKHVTDPDAVVIGRWAAPLVFETDVLHYYVKWGFNTDQETMAALGITHAIFRERDEESRVHLRKFGAQSREYVVLAEHEVRGETVKLVRFNQTIGR